MIGRLQGKLIGKKAPKLLLDVQGVGYEIEAPMTTFYQLPEVGSKVVLLTHLTVRDDAHLLYGFATEGERALFRSLIKVNGVGAKLALAIISGISAVDFAHCINNHDIATLVRLPGIGKKTAERLIVEMRDRLVDWNWITEPGAEAGSLPGVIRIGGEVKDAIDALTALGYKPQEANQLVKAVDQSGLDSEEIIRLALQRAAGK